MPTVEIASLMRGNLPEVVTPRQFGQEIMQWESGNASAREQIATITLDELRDRGLTADMAENWALAYKMVVRLMPANPSAAGRAELMLHSAQLLRGE